MNMRVGMTLPRPRAVAPRTTMARPASRIATIDWMRGFVMLLMVVDHVSMAFDGSHISEDSAMYAGAATMALPPAEFFTRWMTHICAPTFVFLAGTSLALSVEKRVERGFSAWQIDKTILIRGTLIALLDPTIVSLGSGRWTFQVLFAIGIGMILMAPLRRLPSTALALLAIGWMLLGEIVTAWIWQPPGPTSIPAAFTIGTYGSPGLAVKYPVIPWLAVMMLGWVFGRHLVRFASGSSRVSGKAVLWTAGIAALLLFVLVRWLGLYGDMFLPRSDGSWQQWLHVSKYPPSLSYFALELGLLCLGLALLRTLEPRIGVRPNGMLLVFGQTSMFFYLVHRLVLEVPATWLGLRGFGDLPITYAISALLIVALYPACLWYREVQAAYPRSILRYF